MSRALILKFKHGDGLMLTPVFASALSRLYSTLATPDSLVIPIPLYRWRYVFRRYNQAAELARRLACTHQDGIYAPDILHRKKATSSQAGLNRLQRRRNLAGAFAIDPSARPRLQNKPIMLVDDVMTTGATLFEAARTLRHAGSGAVTAVIIARVG
jgi:ComF family protein